MILKLETKVRAAIDHVDNKMKIKDVSEKFRNKFNLLLLLLLLIIMKMILKFDK